MQMADTYLDQIVEYPSKVIQKISEDKNIVGLLLNKSFNEVTEYDYDRALDDCIYSYQYVDNTVLEVSAYIWVEMDVASVSNEHVKNAELYVTIACHKQFMELDIAKYSGVMGNRRDNLARYVDKLLNGSDVFGIGKLKLKSVRTLSPYNQFVFRELTYEIPDFNLIDGVDEI